MKYNNFNNELILNSSQKEPSLASELWGATKFLIKCTWLGTKFVVKNTPAALGLLWEVKKEISNEIALSIHEAKQQARENELSKEIAQLKFKNQQTKQLENSVASKKQVELNKLQIQLEDEKWLHQL